MSASSRAFDGTIDLADHRELPVGEETGDELNERQVEQLGGVSVDMLLDRLDDAACKVAANTPWGYPGSPPAELVLLTVGDHLAEHANDPGVPRRRCLSRCRSTPVSSSPRLGAQYAQRTRRVREAHVHSEIVPHDATADEPARKRCPAA